MQPEANVSQEQPKNQVQPESGQLAQQANQSPQVQVMGVEASPDIKSEENKTNWAQFRAAREAERKAKLEAEKRAAEKAAEAEALKAALEAALKPSNPYQQNQYQPQQFDQYGQPQQPQEYQDDIINRKVEEALAKRYAQEEQQRKAREAAEMPNRLQAAYPDFQRVCTQENLDYFEFHHPEIARGYALAPDSEAKWAGIYQAIKKYVPNTKQAHADAQRIDQNLSKPQSLSKTGAATGGHAMPEARLTEERKAANWARMQEIMNQID